MLRKDSEHLERRVQLFRREITGLKVSLLQFFAVRVYAPLAREFDGALELGCGRMLSEHLTGLKEANQLIAHADGYSGMGQTVRTSHHAGLVSGPFRKSLLHPQTSGARAALLRHQRAEAIFVLPMAMDGFPGLCRPQSEWHSGRFSVGAFIGSVQVAFADCFQDGFALRCQNYTFLKLARVELRVVSLTIRGPDEALPIPCTHAVP
jgi:hypothetical protein